MFTLAHNMIIITIMIKKSEYDSMLFHCVKFFRTASCARLQIQWEISFDNFPAFLMFGYNCKYRVCHFSLFHAC